MPLGPSGDVAVGSADAGVSRDALGTTLVRTRCYFDPSDGVRLNEMRYQAIEIGRHALAALVVSASLFGCGASAPFKRLASTDLRCGQMQLGTLRFVSPEVGWARGSWASHRAILRTIDGGRTWRNVTPPSIPAMLTGPVVTAFLNGTHASIVGHESRRQDSVVLTSNGGLTWRRVLLEVAEGNNYAPYFAVVTFLGERTRWLDTIDTGMNERIQRLYQTMDGGAHWQQIASGLPICAILGFQTPSLGYGADIEGGGGPSIVYRSGDGGRHWQPHPLSLPSIYRHVRVTVTFGPVQLRGHRTATLPAFIAPLDLHSHASLVVYRSDDGGLHWLRRAPLDLHSSAIDVDIAFANVMDGWAITNRGLYRTKDAGKTWGKINTNTKLRLGDAIDFVTTRIGFTLRWMKDGQTLLRTNDGGRTWQIVSGASFL